MSKVKCETYRQRCDCLGTHGMGIDYILRTNGVFVPTPAMMSIRDSIKALEANDGDLPISELISIRKRAHEEYEKAVGPDVRTVFLLEEYDAQSKADSISLWVRDLFQSPEPTAKDLEEVCDKIREILTRDLVEVKRQNDGK